MKRFFLLLVTLAVALSAHAQIELSKASMQFDMRDYAGAIASYQDALSQDPGNIEICAAIAACYVQLQDNLQASQWYEKVIDKEAVKPEYILSYGHVLKSLRLYAKAKFYYQKYSQYDAHVARHFVQSCDLAKAEMAGPELYEITAMAVNTPFAEFAPSVVDGDIVFNSFRTDIQAKRSAENGDAELSVENELFVSGNYGKKSVKHFIRPVKGDQGVGHVRYSANGKWVVFEKNDFRPGQRLFDVRPGKTSLFIGEVNDKGEWTSIRPFDFNSNEHANGYPALSADGSVLYFASTRPGGYGGWDIYVSFKASTGWTSPQNLGPVVNTAGNELAPSYFNKVLYFSSDWHEGLGGFDVFKATSASGQWTAVRSMGYPLNSPKDDIDYVWDADSGVGYFVSNRIGGQGQYDLYASKPLYEEITMVVKEQGDETPVDGAVIKYKGDVLPSTATDKHGLAVIHQPLEGTREIIVSRKGYKDLNMELRAEGQGPSRYEVFIDRTPAAEPVALESVETIAEEPVKEESSTVPVAKEVIAKTATKPVTTSKANTKTTTDKKVAIATDAYAIQVAALGRASNLSQYETLEKYGAVMQVPEGKYHKIRVGYYKSEREARNALGKIKSVGYPDAFVVKTVGNAVSQVKEKTTVRPVAGEKYMVRLATYSKPGSFDASKVEHLGSVESYRKNQLTIMLLSGYSTISEAEEAREGAHHQGFRDAYVVINRDGQLQKVTTAVTER